MTERFFAAAAEDDTVVLRELAATAQPTEFYRHHRSADPGMFAAAARTLKLRDVADGAAADDLGALLTFTYNGEKSTLSVAYVREDSTLKIRKLFLTDAM